MDCDAGDFAYDIASRRWSQERTELEAALTTERAAREKAKAERDGFKAALNDLQAQRDIRKDAFDSIVWLTRAEAADLAAAESRADALARELDEARKRGNCLHCEGSGRIEGGANADGDVAMERCPVCGGSGNLGDAMAAEVARHICTGGDLDSARRELAEARSMLAEVAKCLAEYYGFCAGEPRVGELEDRTAGLLALLWGEPHPDALRAARVMPQEGE